MATGESRARRGATMRRCAPLLLVALVATACGTSPTTSPTPKPSHSPTATATPAPTATPVPTPLPLSALTNPNPPGPLSGFSAGYDPVTRQLIVEGGNPGGTRGTFTAATLAWDGTAWTQLSPATTPAPEAEGSMAVDPVSGHLMYMGGDAAAASYAPNEGTWLWNGSTWARVADNPCQGDYPALAVDQSTKQLLANCAGPMGGGGQPPAWYNSGDYLWTGSGWTQALMSTAGDTQDGITIAMVGMHPAVAYDPISQRVIEFGGGQQYAFNGTMAYDGTEWAVVQLPDPSNPPGIPPGDDASAATDGTAGQIVMLTGAEGSSSQASTWTWSGSGWVSQSVKEPPATVLGDGNFQLVWDPAIGRIVLVDWPGGGNLQMWVWAGTAAGWDQIPS